MMDRSRIARRLAPVFALFVAVTGAWVLIKAWPKWQAARLADAWREQLETADDERVPVLVDELADLGDAGLDRLVAALASPRQIVRQHAAAALGRMVDRWEICDDSARSIAAGELSSLLARHIGTFPADARDNAASLVQQMLVWPTDEAFVDRTQLVASCEEVLLAADDVETESPGRLAIARRNDRRPIAQVADDPATLAPLPGGGLVVEPSAAPPLPRVVEPAEPAPARDPREPRLLLDETGESLPPAPLPIVDPAVDPARRPAAPAQGKTPSRPANYTPSVREKAGGSSNAPQALGATDAATETASTAAVDGPHTEREMSLIRLLHSDGPIALEAERQLAALGYGIRDIALAECIAHPDADFRLQFVDALPRTDGIRPRRWLEMLLADDDPRVRLAAMTQLATSGDAVLVESLARRAQLDPDPEVRRQAERLRGAKTR